MGRWFSVDPLAEKYPNISPFTYVANNPLKYIDPDGMRLILGFENQRARETYENIVNSMLEGQFKLKFKAIEGSDNQFEVSVEATKGKGNFDKLSANGQEFYSEFTNVTKNESFSADMTVVIDDPNVDVGNYKNNILDIGDVAALPSHDLCNSEQPGPTQGGKIIHETVEQFGKGVDDVPRGSDKNYYGNHERAQDAEDYVNKNKRGRDSWGGSSGAVQQYNSNSHGNTKWQFSYGRKKGERTKVKRTQ